MCTKVHWYNWNLRKKDFPVQIERGQTAHNIYLQSERERERTNKNLCFQTWVDSSTRKLSSTSSSLSLSLSLSLALVYLHIVHPLHSLSHIFLFLTLSLFLRDVSGVFRTFFDVFETTQKSLKRRFKRRRRRRRRWRHLQSLSSIRFLKKFGTFTRWLFLKLGHSAVRPDWASFEKSWLQIFYQKYHKYLMTFWAILQNVTRYLNKNWSGVCLGSFWRKNWLFLFYHQVTLILGTFWFIFGCF